MKSILFLYFGCFLSFNALTQIDFGEQQIIATNANGARSVFATDIDGDGDIDVLSASFHDDKIAWYENTDGIGTFGEQQIISTDAVGAYSVYATDIDGDGDMDVLSASFHDDKIAWYENTDGIGTFGGQRIISTNADGATAVHATDIDGDGDMDVLSASSLDDKITWYENIDGIGTFGERQIIPTNEILAKSTFATDIDGDGDMDVLSAFHYRIVWNENIDGLGNFGGQQTITTTNDAELTDIVCAADIDGDGDMDVLTDPHEKVVWYENTDGMGIFAEQQLISTNTFASSIYTTDIDGDGDMDVLSASNGDDKIAWYENIDGIEAFGEQQIITTDANAPISVYATDIDGDGDMDVLSASRDDDKIAWYANNGILNPTLPIAIRHFDIFPIPTPDYIIIDSKVKITQLEIFNRLGQLVLSNVNKTTIDLSSLAPGLYFCSVKDKNGNFVVRKVVKE